MSLIEHFKCLNNKQKQNSEKILSQLFYLYSFKLKKIEIFDPFLNKKVWVYYLVIDGNNFPLSQEDYEILRVLGLDEIII